MNFFCPMCGANLGGYGSGPNCDHVVYRWDPSPSRESGSRAFDNRSFEGDDQDSLRELEATWEALILWLFPDDELVNEGIEPQDERAQERLGRLMSILAEVPPREPMWSWSDFLQWLAGQMDELTYFEGDDAWDLGRDAGEAIALWWHRRLEGTLTFVDWAPDGDDYRHYGFAFALSADQAESLRDDFLGKIRFISAALRDALASASGQEGLPS